jgi:hypothetical protein
MKNFFRYLADHPAITVLAILVALPTVLTFALFCIGAVVLHPVLAIIATIVLVAGTYVVCKLLRQHNHQTRRTIQPRSSREQSLLKLRNVRQKTIDAFIADKVGNHVRWAWLGGFTSNEISVCFGNGNTAHAVAFFGSEDTVIKIECNNGRNFYAVSPAEVRAAQKKIKSVCEFVRTHVSKDAECILKHEGSATEPYEVIVKSSKGDPFIGTVTFDGTAVLKVECSNGLIYPIVKAAPQKSGPETPNVAYVENWKAEHASIINAAGFTPEAEIDCKGLSFAERKVLCRLLVDAGFETAVPVKSKRAVKTTMASPSSN